MPCRRVFRLDLRLHFVSRFSPVVSFPRISPRSSSCFAFACFFTRVERFGCSFPSQVGRGAACQCRGCGFSPWVGKIPWCRKWRPTPVFLPEKSHGQRSLAGYSPWGCKETNTPETLSTPRPGDVQRGSQLTCDVRFSTSGAFQSLPASALLRLQCVGLPAITCPRPHSWELRI